MEHFINLLREWQPYTRIVWYALGIIGMWIFTYTRPEFYRNKSNLWLALNLIASLVLGPAVFLFSLFTLFKRSK